MEIFRFDVFLCVFDMCDVRLRAFSADRLTSPTAQILHSSIKKIIKNKKMCFPTNFQLIFSAVEWSRP